MNETSKSKESHEIKNRKRLKRIDGNYLLGEISSVFNLDKGIFYTTRELFIRPGKTVREFLFYDRKRLVKPIFFVVFSTLVFIITQQLFGFTTGIAPENIGSDGINAAFKWAGENFGVVNIFLGFLIGLWIRLFFLKSEFNIYEICVLAFYIIGIGNLIYTFSGIVETAIGLSSNNLTYFFVASYSTWAIGNFFTKRHIRSYLKGFLAYILGTITGSFLTICVGILIDIVNKSS